MTGQTHNPYLLLDSVIGWQAAFQNVMESDAGALSVDALPGYAESFRPAPEQVQCPTALATDGKGRLVAADGRRAGLFVWSNPSPETAMAAAERMRGLEGGGVAGRLGRILGIALGSDGTLAIADAHYRRVVMYAPDGLGLLAVWDEAVMGDGTVPGPIAADGCGSFYLIDRGLGRGLRLSRHEPKPVELKAPWFDRPRDVAMSGSGALAVLDAKGIKFIERPDGPVRAELAVNATSIAFDTAGFLYAGTTDGMVRRLQLAWIPVDVAVERTGEIGVAALDSRIARCVWHRVALRGEAPPGTSIELQTQTTDDKDAFWNPPIALTLTGDNPDAVIQSPPGRYLRIRLMLRTNGRVSPVVKNIKVYFPRKGYLQHLPAVFQEDPDSHVFLDRFLAIFQTSFDGLDERIDRLPRLFNPASVEEKYLPWLAAWLALPLAPEWPAAKKRAMLASAFSDYQRRGTPAGLEKVIRDYAGVDNALVVEHFKLRRAFFEGELCNGRRLWSRSFERRLQLEAYSRLGYFRLVDKPEPDIEALNWGAHRFTVFFHANALDVDVTRRRVMRVVEAAKPAHTEAVYCPVFARLRVGVQSTLGVDSAVGGVEQLVLCKVATLGYDSILACAPREQMVRKFGGSVRPRAGVSASLL